MEFRESVIKDLSSFPLIESVELASSGDELEVTPNTVSSEDREVINSVLKSVAPNYVSDVSGEDVVVIKYEKESNTYRVLTTDPS